MLIQPCVNVSYHYITQL